MLDTAPLRTVLDLGFIKIYSGTVPSSADDGLGAAVLLCTVSVDGLGGGLGFDIAASSGVIAKSTTETWKGTNVASGTAAFYRHVLAADTGALSTTDPRIQGAVALAGAELNLTSINLISGADQKIDFYTVALPTL